MRTPFQFPLSPVLSLRARAVESARSALGAAVAERLAAEAAVVRARAALDAALAPAADAGTAAQLGGAVAHRTRLGRALDAARAVADHRRTAERAARTALASALRQHEAIDSLRVEAADEHRTEALRAETVALDDLAATRALPS